MITIEPSKARPKGGEYARRAKTRAPRVVRVRSAEKGPRIVTDLVKRKKLASFMLLLGLRDSDNPRRSGIAMCEWARANGADLEGYVYLEKIDYSTKPGGAIMEYLLDSQSGYDPSLFCDPEEGCIFKEPSPDDVSHTVGAYSAQMNQNVLALCWLLEQGVSDPDSKIIESLFRQVFKHYNIGWMRWIIKHGTAKQEWFEEGNAWLKVQMRPLGAARSPSIMEHYDHFVAVMDEGIAACRKAKLEAALPVARPEVQAGTRRF